MRKIYRIVILVIALMVMTPWLQAQEPRDPSTAQLPDNVNPAMTLENEMVVWQRAKQYPLTNAGGELIKVGEVTWARAIGETEFYLAPTTTDPAAYFSRIRALDNKQNGVVKSRFKIVMVPLNEAIKPLLTNMGITIPGYYTENQVNVMLPGIDIDILQANVSDIKVLDDYGKKLTPPTELDGTSSTVWSEGWEGSLANYTIGSGSGSPSTTWGKVSCDKYSGSWSLWCAADGAFPRPHCGTYAANMNTYIYKTTGVDVSSYANIQLRYYEKYETEAGFDYYNFLYSGNGTGWTTYLNLDGTSSGYPAWILHTINFATGWSTLFWRFEFNSDISNQYGGAYIDNMEITGDPGCNSASQYPSSTLIPESNWKQQSGIYAGEYARFSVVSGTLYQWSLCDEHCGNASYDSEITLRRASDDMILAYINDACGDDARVSWTANFTGEVKVVITKYPCTTQNTSTRLSYKSGALEDASLSVSPTNRNVAYSSTSTTFAITSNSSWTITGMPAWVTSVTPSSGIGTQTITVNYEPNNQGGAERIATLFASMSCEAISFTITQYADPGCSSNNQYGGSTYAPTANWKYLSSMYGGEYALFAVTSGTEYHWSLCPDQGGDASYDSQLTLRNPADNTNLAWSNSACGDDARITWTATYTGNVKVVVSQYPCVTNAIYTRLAYKSGSLINPSMSVSPASRTVDAFSGSTTFTLTSNTTWQLGGYPTWITSVVPSVGSGNATITVTYSTNSNAASRTGTITAYAPGLANVPFNVVQLYKCNSTSQYPLGTLTPASYWKYQSNIFAGEYSLHSVVAGTTYHWSLCPTHGGNAPYYDPELTLRNAATEELLAYANDNCSNPSYLGATISWTATFTGNVKVVVTEYSCNTNTVATCLAYKYGTLTDAALAISPTNRTVSYGSGSTTFSLTANGAWSISSWPVWVTSVSPTSGTGNATITVNYSANNTGGPTRMATITATMGCVISESCTVTQDSDPGCNSSSIHSTETPVANWKYLPVMYPGEYVIFHVVNGTTYQWSLCPEHCGSASYDSELTLRNAAGDVFIAYSNDVCGDDARISWTANFTGDVKLILTKYQCQSQSTSTRLAYKSGALDLPTLSVSPVNRNVSSAAGSTTFTITSNASWTISGLPGWITSVTPSTIGIGTTTITVNYLDNGTAIQRVATLSVALPCGGSQTFTITQGEEATVCPNYDLSIGATTTWLTHSASHGTYGGKIYRLPVISGRVYTFKTGCGDGATANYDTYLELFNASCGLIAFDDDGCSNLQSKIEWTATYTGWAYLKVMGLGSSWGNYTMAYRFEGCMEGVQYVGPLTVTDSWTWVSNIYPGEYATFNVTLGTQYNWSLCPDHCGSASYDSELTLRNLADNSFLAYSNDVCGDDARISWTAPFTGTVKVAVTKYPCTGENNGSYLAYKSGVLANPFVSVSPVNNNVSSDAGSTTFSVTANVSWYMATTATWLTSSVPSSGTGDALVTVSYNANTVGPQRVASIEFIPYCGTTVTRTITQGEDHVECPTFNFGIVPGTSWNTHSSSHGTFSSIMYRVSISNNQKYTFKTGCGDGATADYDTYLELYDASCNMIAYNDDDCETNRSQIVWISDYTGYAYLKVRGFGTSGVNYGDYTLAYQRCALPAQPGTISGNTTPCQGSANTYSVTPVAGATSYTWTLPAGWSGTSTSNAIVATTGTSGGVIRVIANNDCGSGIEKTLLVSVQSIPAQPGAISGPASVLQGSTYIYSVSSVAGVTYTWTLPYGWTGSSVTNSISATAGASGGLISVIAGNVCGTSPARTLTVTSTSIPVSQTLQNIIIAPGQNECYNALQTITLAGGGTSFVVQNNGSVELVAGQNIILLPGVQVVSGGYLLGRITTTNDYCGLKAATIVNAITGVLEPVEIPEGVLFSIFPNPSTGKFTLWQRSGTLNGAVKVEIFSIRGEQIYQATLTGEVKHEFNLDNKAGGLYILKVMKDDHLETFKLILNK
jgi:hypothetical protein